MSALSDLFQSIADAIRTKTGDTAVMTPASFPENILAIETGDGSGDSDAGASSIVTASGWTDSSNRGVARTVTHNLGVVPDIVYFSWNALGNTPTTTVYLGAIGFSQAFVDVYGVGGQYMAYNGTNGAFVGVGGTIIVDGDNSFIYDATTTQVTFGSSTYPLDTSQNYRWLAIGGLT